MIFRVFISRSSKETSGSVIVNVPRIEQINSEQGYNTSEYIALLTQL